MFVFYLFSFFFEIASCTSSGGTRTLPSLATLQTCRRNFFLKKNKLGNQLFWFVFSTRTAAITGRYYPKKSNNSFFFLFKRLQQLRRSGKMREITIRNKTNIINIFLGIAMFFALRRPRSAWRSLAAAAARSVPSSSPQSRSGRTSTVPCQRRRRRRTNWSWIIKSILNFFVIVFRFQGVFGKAAGGATVIGGG